MPYLILIGSLIAPIYSLLFAMFETLKKQSGRIPNISIALAFASLSFAFNPTKEYDIVRHYQRIESLKGLSLATIIEKSNNGYYLFDSYAWLLNFFSLPKGLLPFIAVFISYLLILSLFTDIKLKYLQKHSFRVIALVFIAFWLSLSFVALSTGVRFPLASVTMVYATYNLYLYNKKILFIVLSLISFYIHPFSLVLFILSFIAYVFRGHSEKAKVLVYVGIALIAITKYISLNTNYIQSILKAISLYSESYFVGEYGISGPELNIYGKIFIIYLPNLVTVIILLYLMMAKAKKNNAFYLLLCMITMYLGFFSSYFTFYTRMTSFFTSIFVIFLTYEYIKNKSKFNDFFLIAFFSSLTLFSLGMMFIYFPDLISTGKEVLYKPFLFMLFDL